MISVIVSASEDTAALSALLSALVPAAADGLVREVKVLGAEGSAAEVADDAGASLYPLDGFVAAIAAARGPWLAGLPLEARLRPDWMATVAAHVALAPAPARLVAAGFGVARGPRGWLAPKALAPSASAVEEDFQRLARRSGRRLRVFERR